MNDGREKIPKMKVKTLKKMRQRLKKTWAKTWIEWDKATRHQIETESSLAKIRGLETRINYWIGKSKATDCPAHLHTGHSEVRCAVHSNGWDSWSMRHLYSNYCSKCKLSKKEAMKQATFNGIFGKAI